MPARSPPWRLTFRAALLGLALIAPAAGATEPSRVDLELLLAMDSSASVNFAEFALQAAGTARALADPEVIEAIGLYAPGGVAISVVQWSGRYEQRVAIDWTRVSAPPSIEALASRIEAMSRSSISETALGDMLRFAIDHIERSPFQGARRLIDVSGDGRANAGPAPGPIRDAAALAGITINGLAILNDDVTLDLYYADHVIGGPGAFVMTADDYHDVLRAMRGKLLREIRGAPLG